MHVARCTAIRPFASPEFLKESRTMNMTNPINALASSADLSKAAAERALDAFGRHLKGHIDAGRAGICQQWHRPAPGTPHRCAGYLPHATDTDQRHGGERWPGLIPKGGE
jgi:hypothetical protein